MPAATSARTVGLIFAALGAVGFSGKAIIVKIGYRYGVDAVVLLAYRMLFALPFFVGMAWWAGRGQAPIARRHWWGIAGLGFCGYYLASFLDFLGLQYISASLERLILYLNPTLVLVLGAVLLGKRIAARQWIAMALSYLGVLVVFAQELKFEGSNVALGASLVFASALSYAVYLLYSGELVKSIGSMRLVGWATTVACALCIGQFLVLRPISAAVVPNEVLWLSILNASLCTAAPVLMVMMAIERIGSSLAAQVGMIGPMSTIALGAIFLSEPMTWRTAVGTLLVLAGVAWVSRPK
jgi:drug/metabolite transporter (DMT)-like permease